MNKFLNIYYKIDDAFELFIKYLCAVLLAIMIIVCFGNTFCRYFLGFSFKWAEEIVRYAAVWVTCVGASLTAREDDHVAMVLGYLRITPPKVKKIWTNTVEKTEFDLINEGVIE